MTGIQQVIDAAESCIVDDTATIVLLHSASIVVEVKIAYFQQSLSNVATQMTAIDLKCVQLYQ